MSLPLLKILVFLAMIALPIGLYVWARRRKSRPLTIDPRLAWEAVKNGAPMEGELARSYIAYAVANARPAFGVVEHALGDDRWGVRLQDGAWVNATRAHRMWKYGVTVKPGDRVELTMVPGDDKATIVNRP
jgi:translation initiation factor IF-1